MSNWSDVIQRANTDPQFRNRLKANPAAAAKEAGVTVPSGANVEVIEEGPGEVHLYLGTQTKSPDVNRVLERAEKDPDFRKQLLANPNLTVDSVVDQKLPAGAQVRVHEPKANTVRLILSPSSDAQGDLGDAQLEAVAGGGRFAEIWSGVKDLFCRDVPIVAVVTDSQETSRPVAGLAYETTKSGNIEGTGVGIYVR